jgi:16S rRNA (uracil1498-N3)-methyltransferase
VSNFSIINQYNIKNSTFVLDEKESHHVISVLRLKESDQLTLTDGQGTIYKAIIDKADKKAVKGKILSKEHIKTGKNFKIHLALPLIKNNRFKIALEKSVELGIDELTPIRFDKSVKSSINHDKLLSSIHSACKHSMRSYFPKLNKLKKFSEWHDNQSVNIACLINSDKTIVEQLDTIKDLSKNKKINLIVGPEGDFSENEKKIINEKNFIKVNLGRTILRTETAIVSLISIINELLINND